MLVTGDGVAADALIAAIKNSIKRAEISASSERADLRVTAVQLILRTIAVVTSGGAIDIRVPFLGMRLRAGAKVTKQDTHNLDLTLVPPSSLETLEIRDSDIEETLVDAIISIRKVIESARKGDDPWELDAGTIEIEFVVTESGTISLGVEGELSGELTHTLRLSLTSN